jgi:hypothetical protein
MPKTTKLARQVDRHLLSTMCDRKEVNENGWASSVGCGRDWGRLLVGVCALVHCHPKNITDITGYCTVLISGRRCAVFGLPALVGHVGQNIFMREVAVFTYNLSMMQGHKKVSANKCSRAVIMTVTCEAMTYAQK